MKRYARKNYSPFSFRLVITTIIAFAIPFTSLLLREQTQLQQKAQGQIAFQLSPNTNKVTTEKIISIAITIDSETTPIKGVYVNLGYPQNKLEPISIDTHDSSFEIQTDEIKKNGLIVMGRNTNTPTKGKSYIATIQFKSKQDATSNEITLFPNSSATASDDKVLSFTTTQEQKDLQNSSSIIERFIQRAIVINNSIWDFIVISVFGEITNLFLSYWPL